MRQYQGQGSLAGRGRGAHVVAVGAAGQRVRLAAVGAMLLVGTHNREGLPGTFVFFPVGGGHLPASCVCLPILLNTALMTDPLCLAVCCSTTSRRVRWSKASACCLRRCLRRVQVPQVPLVLPGSSPGCHCWWLLLLLVRRRCTATCVRSWTNGWQGTHRPSTWHG